MSDSSCSFGVAATVVAAKVDIIIMTAQILAITLLNFFIAFVHIYIAFCSVKELTIFLFITAKSTFDFAQWDEVDFWEQFCSCYIFNNNYFVKNYSNRIRMEIVKYTYRLLLHCS